MKLNFKSVLRGIRNLILFFFISTILAVVAYRFLPVYLTPLMPIRCVQQATHGQTIRLKHHWVPLKQISTYLPLAVISSEDQNFEKHHGFDFTAIEKAIEERQRKHRKRGGSTISQQTAKNVFLWPASSWVRKGFEVYFTCLIELCWSKERIMEVYLNSIEMGDGIYGAEAVAQQHFNTEAVNLSKQQCALIAATLPNPIRMDSGNPSRHVIKRQGWILRQMRYFKSFPSKEKEKKAE